MKYINICILLLYAILLSRCGIEEELFQDASCSIESYENSDLSVCQDYGEIDPAKTAALRQACTDNQGKFGEDKACSVSRGSVGCVKTLSYSGVSVNTTTWFDGITNSELLDSSLTSSCESIKSF